MRRKPEFFELVREGSRNLWNQLDANRQLSGPWWLLFKQIQNPRHVLSELLQNADDAGATEASVDITYNSIVFRHNGHDFSEEEFRSLCQFGFSNKRRLLTIGFRGIGFKSVFSLGSAPQVLTPTLAFSFELNRFTQPEWIDTADVTDQTVVRVPFESPEKERAIRVQIKNWTQSTAPLLLFQSIRTLRLLDRSIRVETDVAGPCPRSRIVTLSGSGGVIQVFRSGEEEFPQECLDEIRAERNEGTIALPPCEVVIFMGAAQQQRLFCVLPTDVTVELPFSCQAPFVQDPARSAIKDPSTSPTNAWLLDRIGRLAAESLLTWLNRNDLDALERARAYDLLPTLTSLNSGLLSGIATQRILDAFRKCIERKDLLLCADGKIDNAQHTAHLPGAVLEAWGADDARARFTPDKRSVLARQVPAGARKRLEAWKFLAPTSLETMWKVLADESELAPYRPAQLQTLAAFWAFAHQNLPLDWAQADWWRNAAIVPLSGLSRLGRAKNTLPSRDCPSGCPPADWQFITERAEILDESWGGLIGRIEKNRAEAQRELEETYGRRFTDRELGGLLDGFRRAKLDQAPTLDRVFEQVAPRIMGATEPSSADATRFLQIAATMNVSFPESVELRFLCEDGRWRSRAEGLLTRSDIDLERLLPATWLKKHLIVASYTAGLSPPDARAWRKWVTDPKKGGLSEFPLPVQSIDDRVWVIDKAFFQTRGAEIPQKEYRTKWIQSRDWNWSDEIWSHWHKQEAEDGVSIWTEICWAVVSTWSIHWEHRTRYELRQFGYGSWSRLDNRDVPATWLFELRNHKCALDSHGDPRLPPDLYRRVPDTLALLDVEPFILESWDLPEYARALDELGTRTQPADAGRLLERLRALSQADKPPIGPLRDLYRAIERVLPRLPEVQKVKVCSAFASEPLVRTECGWARSGFCFRGNPRCIPGVSVVHPDIRDRIGLWDVLKLPTEPSAADALRWLESLPLDTPLIESDRSAVRKILELYPSEVWAEKSRWLNLQARIARTADLKWGCLDPGSLPGLFTSVRIGTADFSMVDGNRLKVLPIELPPLLDTVVERRVLQYQPGPWIATTEESWLHALGRVLSLLSDGDAKESALEFDRRAAQRMVGTRWVPAQSVKIQPFLDGEPVGTESQLKVAWVLDLLYVQGDSIRVYKSLVREISRQFATATALDTIRDCVGRDPEWIQAYADEHLQLSTQPPIEPPLRPIPTNDDPISVFPPDGEPPPAKHEPPITVITDPPGVPPTARPTPPGGGKPSPPKEPTKLERLGRFLTSRGFEWQATTEVFVHADGSVVRSSEGIFPWELASGRRVTRLWLAATSLSAPNGIEVPAEVWLAGERDDAVLLAPDGDGYIELRFSSLRAQVDQLILELYPATFRIRVPDEA